MSAMKIKKGDTVKVIAGKDKGKEGKVLAVNVKDNTVIVEGINHQLQTRLAESQQKKLLFTFPT